MYFLRPSPTAFFVSEAYPCSSTAMARTVTTLAECGSMLRFVTHHLQTDLVIVSGSPWPGPDVAGLRQVDEADVIPRQGGFRASDNFTLPIDTIGRHEIILSLTCATPGAAGGDVIISQTSSAFQARLSCYSGQLSTLLAAQWSADLASALFGLHHPALSHSLRDLERAAMSGHGSRALPRR